MVQAEPVAVGQAEPGLWARRTEALAARDRIRADPQLQMQVRLQKLATRTRKDSEELPKLEVGSRDPLVLRETGRPLRLREAQAADPAYLRAEMDVASTSIRVG